MAFIRIVLCGAFSLRRFLPKPKQRRARTCTAVGRNPMFLANFTQLGRMHNSTVVLVVMVRAASSQRSYYTLLHHRCRCRDRRNATSKEGRIAFCNACHAICSFCARCTLVRVRNLIPEAMMIWWFKSADDPFEWATWMMSRVCVCYNYSVIPNFYAHIV